MGALLSLFLVAAYRPRLYFAETPASIRVRKTGSKELEDVTLSTLITSKCPTLFTRFRPAWWLKGCVIMHLTLVVSRLTILQWTPSDILFRYR